MATHRLAVAIFLAASLWLTPQALGQTTDQVYDEEGNLVETPFVPPPSEPLLTDSEVLARVFRREKVASWVARYPADEITEEANFDGNRGVWEVKVWAEGDAGQIVRAKVEDDSGRVTEAWTGPQVAWSMARGSKGSFGRSINDSAIWFGLSAAFFVGLANWRRPLSLRNLDLLVLLSFSASWWFFNEGEIFTSVPLAYPPLVYLLGRMAWIGSRGRTSPSQPLWPVWLLAAATVFLAGFRIGLNVSDSNVIDVGFASVVGAQRIAGQGESPYGHMPNMEGEECGEPDANGRVRDRIQTNGRCETSVARGDTYGPVTYIAYIPGYLAFGWSGKWDNEVGVSFGNLPAAHFTSIAVDILAMLGMFLLGRHFGGTGFGVALAFAWAAYPFTQYVSSSNSNDAVMPLLLIYGLLLVASPPGRGLLLGLASWAKFAPLLLVPLWATYPHGARARLTAIRFGLGFLLATVLAFLILFLEPNPLSAAGTFWDRTFGWQLDRASPFSIWDWGRYRYPDLSAVQIALQGLLIVSAVAVAFLPGIRTPLQLAALSAALLIGFEIVLTHWFYLYIPWFFPFVAFAVLAPTLTRETVASVEEVKTERPVRELAPAG